MKILVGEDRQNIPLKILTEIIWSTIWQVIARKIILLRKNKNNNVFDGVQKD